MTEAETRSLIWTILGGIAPEADSSAVTDNEDLREALDLDSMDFLNFVVGLHERTGIDIPEADYPQFHTLNSAVAYLGRANARLMVIARSPSCCSGARS
jgi:acyl carrier protein